MENKSSAFKAVVAFCMVAVLMIALVGCASQGKNENNSTDSPSTTSTNAKETVISNFKSILEDTDGFNGSYLIKLTTPSDDGSGTKYPGNAEISGQYNFDSYNQGIPWNSAFTLTENMASNGSSMEYSVVYKDGIASRTVDGFITEDPAYSPTQAFQMTGLIFFDPQVLDEFITEASEEDPGSYELRPLDEGYTDFVMNSISDACGAMGSGAKFSSDDYTVIAEFADDGSATYKMFIHGKSDYDNTEYTAELLYSVKAN